MDGDTTGAGSGTAAAGFVSSQQSAPGAPEIVADAGRATQDQEWHSPGFGEYASYRKFVGRATCFDENGGAGKG